MFQGKWYDEVSVGERFGTGLTVTEAHLVLGAGLFGDFNPLHVNEEFARRSMFGTRILHGPFTSALFSAPVGMYFSGTARKQDGEVAVEAEGKLLVASRPAG